jgi:hypothetical protein
MVAMEVYKRVEHGQDVMKVIPIPYDPVGLHLIHTPSDQNQVTQHYGQKRSL